MHERLFAIVSDGGYYLGLQALLNSIHAYHAKEIPVFVYHRGLDAKQVKWIEAHPAGVQAWPVEKLPLPASGMWEAKQLVFAHCLGQARCVYLLDADIVLVSRVDDVFASAADGKIVSSADGNGTTFGKEYAAYGVKLPGQRQPYINSGALCLDVIRHWDVVGLWAFASKYGAYSPGGGAPLRLPGHGDQGVFNPIAGLLGKVEHFHVLPESLWCDSTKGCRVQIRSRDASGQIVVWNLNENAQQRLVHCSGPKWWTEEGAKHLQLFGDKLECFRHFMAAREVGSGLPDRVTTQGAPAPAGKVKVLIGICSCHRTAAKRKAVRETWLRNLPEGVSALFFVGDSKPVEEEAVVSLPAPDDYDHLPAKVHSFYRYALAHHQFDYLFKCDDDTYVHVERLRNLPVPDVHFMGSAQLKSSGFASGGAGYLMSRKMVEHLVATPMNPCGAEDRIVSARALASGMRWVSTPLLHGYADHFPEPENQQITAHWCQPDVMKRIHGGLTGEQSGPPVVKLDARHKAWVGTVRLYRDGSFLGGVASPNGTWATGDEGKVLILQWYHWGAVTLVRRPWGFEEPNMQLRFPAGTEADAWRRFLESPRPRSVQSPRVIVEYNGRLGNQLFGFATGWVLAQKAGVPLSAAEVPGFPGTRNFDFGQARYQPLSTAASDKMRLDIDACLSHLKGGRDVVVNGYHQRYEIIRPMKQELRALFSSLNVPALEETPGSEDLVAHVRLGDYFLPKNTAMYAYPLDEVRRVIGQQKFKQLFVATDEPKHAFIRQLQSECNARLVEKNALETFAFLRAAKRLVITPSTFSWWAAWLSQAEQILFPARKGPWNQPDGLDLWVDDEPRYVAY